jgi:hypothetical protein
MDETSRLRHASPAFCVLSVLFPFLGSFERGQKREKEREEEERRRNTNLLLK